MRRWRGLKALLHDAIDRTTHLVEEGHASAARVPLRVADHIPEITDHAYRVEDVRRVITSSILATVRGVNRVVETVTDAGLDVVEQIVDPPARERPVPMQSDAIGQAAWLGDAAMAAVNAAVGDYLHADRNGLSLDMQLRYGDQYLPLDPLDESAVRTACASGSSKLVVFVHGLGTTEWSWCLNALQYHGDARTHFGTLLERDLGYTPVFVRYNTGRHISENGRLLAAQLETLLQHYPHDVREIVLVGHSMGGLVVRSACHYASEDARNWLARVKRVFCLGSPHKGAPLEKLSNAAAVLLANIDLPGTRIPGLVLQGRSAGIKDLRYGHIVDDDWLGQDPDAIMNSSTREIPLLDDVAYYFVSATLTHDPAHPVGQVLGDLLVRVPSASGPAVRHDTFRIETQCFGSVMHHQLQNHPDVYALIKRACEGSPGAQ